jgi:hypothetical protein
MTKHTFFTLNDINNVLKLTVQLDQLADKSLVARVDIFLSAEVLETAGEDQY